MEQIPASLKTPATLCARAARARTYMYTQTGNRISADFAKPDKSANSLLYMYRLENSSRFHDIVATSRICTLGVARVKHCRLPKIEPLWLLCISSKQLRRMGNEKALDFVRAAAKIMCVWRVCVKVPRWWNGINRRARPWKCSGKPGGGSYFELCGLGRLYGCLVWSIIWRWFFDEFFRKKERAMALLSCQKWYFVGDLCEIYAASSGFIFYICVCKKLLTKNAMIRD